MSQMVLMLIEASKQAVRAGVEVYDKRVQARGC